MMVIKVVPAGTDIIIKLTLLALGFLDGVGPGGGGYFPPPSITPLSLKLGPLKFCTELLRDKMNILQ